MSDSSTLVEDQVLTGPLFNEPMLVVTVTSTGPSAWTLGLVGTRTQQFRRVVVTKDQLAILTILLPSCTYDGDAGRLKLGLQAYALGIAWEFDPYFGLSMSRVDPLPHQLEAVYDYVLKPARVRLRLADDAGAGKPIMALEGLGDAGEWKHVENEIIEFRRDAAPIVRFRPVSVADTPSAIEELCLSYRHVLTQAEVAGLVAVAALVLDFLCVHPFRDGNGQVAPHGSPKGRQGDLPRPGSGSSLAEERVVPP